MRMFAGPNGSGKSTLKPLLPLELLGVYLNPDEIEDEIRERGFLDTGAKCITTTADEVLAFFKNSSFLQSVGLSSAVSGLRFADGRLLFQGLEVNSYFASVAADFLRQKLLQKNASFTFETVMSSPDKVALLEKAQGLGYRTYLYQHLPRAQPGPTGWPLCARRQDHQSLLALAEFTCGRSSAYQPRLRLRQLWASARRDLAR